MTGKQYLDVGKLPTKAVDLARKLNLVDENQNLMVDSEANPTTIFAVDKEGWTHPAIILIEGGRKAYVIEQNPPRHQDASDLSEYQEVIVLARQGSVRDEETCSAINTIHELIVIYLTAVNIAACKYVPIGVLDSKILNRRGRIQRAKYTALRIWREGKPKKEPTPEKEVENDKVS
jgi:hypothetical protein